VRFSSGLTPGGADETGAFDVAGPSVSWSLRCHHAGTDAHVRHGGWWRQPVAHPSAAGGAPGVVAEPDIYLDRGGRLVVLTEECQEPAAFETDVVLRSRADSDEAELAFPSGQVCPVSFVGNDNAYFTSATEGGYTDVYTGQTVHTAGCPDLSSVEPALVRFDLVILMAERPSVCHLA
jgi:hypothetical protein